MILTITHRLKIMLNGNLSLLRQGLDFCLSVGFPVVNVLVVPDTERSSRENDRADVVVKSQTSGQLPGEPWGHQPPRTGQIGFRPRRPRRRALVRQRGLGRCRYRRRR